MIGRYEETWWTCPKCGMSGGFTGYDDPPDILTGMCVAVPGDGGKKIRGYSLTKKVSCWGCFWSGTWTEAGAEDKWPSTQA